MNDFLQKPVEDAPMWLELAKIIYPLIIAYFVYKYTTSIHKKNLLNELDSKSEWRKKLFEVAGEKDIGLEEIYKLRTSVRFDVKDNPKSIFEKKTNDIIRFCDCITSSHFEIDKHLPYIEQEMTRIYCRYLLANHWEVLQLGFIKRRYYDISKWLCFDCLKSKWYKKELELDRKTNELIANLE